MAKKKKELELILECLEMLTREVKSAGGEIVFLNTRLDRFEMAFKKLVNNMELVPGGIVMIRQSIDNLAKFQHQLTTIVDDIRGRGLHVTSRRDD